MLDIILRDQTTGRNIIWATAEYREKEIQIADVESIKPRWQKLREQQKQRTKDRAEIFTPPEVCKLQNDLIDKAWLRNIAVAWLNQKYNCPKDNLPADKAMIDGDLKKIFAVWSGQADTLTQDTIVAAWLEEKKDLWQAYVDAKFLEITCGEAPYIVSRYNAVTGEPIDIKERVGLLDRKLRVVSRETSTPKAWQDWTIRAVQSVYGYEFQGDSLFLARQNVFDSIIDYYPEKFSDKPSKDFWITIATIITCNLWQMDGSKEAIPYANPQGTLNFGDEPQEPQGEIFCKIMDWRTHEVEQFKKILKGGR